MKLSRAQFVRSGVAKAIADRPGGVYRPAWLEGDLETVDPRGAPQIQTWVL